MFSTDKLSMIYGDRVLFQGVSLHFAARRRYGLVGANGAGKTTFLKLIKGELRATEGLIQIPTGARVGLLDQDFSKFDDKIIMDLVMMGDRELWEAILQKERLLKKGELKESEVETLSHIEELIQRKGGYRAEARAASLLGGLGIPPEKHYDELNTLSGGYKLRVLLAQLLFIEPEILLLDEPTNYLDIFSIRWLERYLLDYPGTVILSSHDRYFLNKVCQEIIDIDYGQMRRYVGDFDHFLKLKKEEVILKEQELSSLAKRKKEIQRFIDKNRAKASKARQASSRGRMIEKLEEEEKGYALYPTSRQYPRFHFPIHRPSGRQAIKAKEISKSFGSKTVLKEVTFEALRNEKIAIVGANGMGKSTFLEIVTGMLDADAGSTRYGPHVSPAYFPQNFSRLLSKELTIYEWLKGQAKETPEEKVRQALGQMLFDEHAVHKKIQALSGGEQARLVFASIALTSQNLLLLDEPTNHLDMEAVDALIQALKDYEGTLIVVSHNRYFISEIADRVIEILPQGIRDFSGGYEEFVLKHEEELQKIKTPKEKKSDHSKRKEERKERNRLKREIERLENEISVFEKEIEKINQILSAPHYYEKTSPDKIQSTLNQKVTIEKKREDALNQWEDKLEELDVTSS